MKETQPTISTQLQHTYHGTHQTGIPNIPHLKDTQTETYEQTSITLNSSNTQYAIDQTTKHPNNAVTQLFKHTHNIIHTLQLN